MTPGEGPLIFVHPSDELYGADRMLLELLASVPADVPVQVWLPTDLPHVPLSLCGELTERGVPFRHVDLPILRRAYRTPTALARLAVKTGRLSKLLREAAPSLVYCTTSAALLAAPAARRARVPRVVGHVQEIWSRTDRRLLTRLAGRCDGLLAISSAVAQALPATLQARTVVVPNATPAPDRVLDLAERTGPLTFVVASRWNAWKGHRTLLAAWDRLDKPGQLVILGGPPAIGEFVDVTAAVAQLRHPRSVTVVGEVADPAPYLDEADVVLMPSDQAEPFGLVAIEAFARGRPVIASAAGGLLDIVTADHDGWLFAPRDTVALTDVLQGLTREQVTKAGAQARATYEHRFTLEQYAERWRAALAHIVAPG